MKKKKRHMLQELPLKKKSALNFAEYVRISSVANSSFLNIRYIPSVVSNKKFHCSRVAI